MALFDTRHDFRIVLLLGLTLLSYGVEGAGRNLGEAAAPTIFDVTMYGANTNPKTDNALSFMKAFRAACASTVPAKVVIPKGTFMSGPALFQGPCKSPEPITFEFQGTAKANTDISAYPDPEWIMFERIDGLVVNGGGTFDGQGATHWKKNVCKKKSKCELLPTSIKFHRVMNSVVENINSVNSMAFHMFLTFCQKVDIVNVTITAPGDSPNTDGIHLSGSNLVNITNTIISTGDDCISVGQGSTNVAISGVVCGPGHGFSIGSLGKYPHEKDVSGISFKNSTLIRTTNGVRIKTWPGSPPSQASGIHFEDIIMDNVKNPIIIDQNYGSKKTQPSRVKISDVRYNNIRGTSISVNPVKLYCSPAVPCSGIEMTDIDFSYSGSAIKKGLIFQSDCLHAKVVFGGKHNPKPCQLK